MFLVSWLYSMGLWITIDNFFCIFFSKKSQIDSNKHYLCFVISSNCTDNPFILASICVILHPAFGTKENLFCLCKLKLLVASSHANSSLLVFSIFKFWETGVLDSQFIGHYTLTKTICNAKNVINHHVEKESRAYK